MHLSVYIVHMYIPNNYKHGKWWTFDFQMLVSVTGSVMLIFELLVSFNIYQIT